MTVAKSYLISGLFLMLVSGCTLFPQGPDTPPQKFTLDILKKEDFSRDASGGVSKTRPSPRVHLALGDSFPVVYAPLDNTRIFLKPSSVSLDNFAESEWADRLGTLIRSSFYFSLQNSGLFASVSGGAETVAAEVMFLLHVQDFQVDYREKEKKSYGFVSYLGELMELPSRRLLASKTFEVATETPASNIQEVVEALNAAHKKAMLSSITWTSTVCSSRGK